MSRILNYLIVTALGPCTTLTVSELTRACHQCGCNILTTKLNQLGQEVAIILYLVGNWGAIAKMETHLITLEKQLGLKIQSRRACEIAPNEASHSYSIKVTAIDKPGILGGLSFFLQREGIPITEIDAETYHTRNGTRMLDLSIDVEIPDQTHLASLREELFNYCDTHNLDAFLEPQRH